MKLNKYCYKTNEGFMSGYFNIYQAKNGCIYLQLNNCVTKLSSKQIQNLKIDCYSLEDFDIDLFNKFYKVVENE